MFANRRSSQKPHEGLYAAFKQSFPEVGPGTMASAAGIAVPSQRGSSSHEAIVESATSHKPFDQPVDSENNDNDDNNNNNNDNGQISRTNGLSPKPINDQWRLTPSMMDPNSFAFSAFANMPPGYHTPPAGSYSTFFHSSTAGDLHTPNLGLNTPMSLPHALHSVQATEGVAHYPQFNAQMLHSGQMLQDNYRSHAYMPQNIHQFPQSYSYQQSYHPPNQFLQHHDSGYVAMDDSSSKTTPSQHEVSTITPNIFPHMSQNDSGISIPTFKPEQHYKDNLMACRPENNSALRFHTTLNAPTAMTRTLDEIPITYLNKGQAYTMTISDRLGIATQQPLRYRTYVRISFEDPTQRAKPGVCWQLWREGRGSNEAHHRGGKLLAVEFVDSTQGTEDTTRKPQVEMEMASFDGFIVNWTPERRVNGSIDCAISVRFNFLSTDFSHSKGVKGIPVRLCAKTELVTELQDIDLNKAEVCFAKVKLFRDHGAERKLSNDIAHVKKSTEKLKQQLAQAEAGMPTIGKRKRSGSVVKSSNTRGKTMKHKRSWSADSDNEAVRVSVEEDLHSKIMSLQDMFSSARSSSVLYLLGEEGDDPDAHPVQLSTSEELKPLVRTQTWEAKPSPEESPGSNIVSPVSSQSTPKRKYAELQKENSIPEEQEVQEDHNDLVKKSLTPDRPSKMIKREHEIPQPGFSALDIDTSYCAPADRENKPVACFYVQEKNAAKEYYRAVYLLARTVKDLIYCISEKFSVDPVRITRITHINARGLRIIVDEDVVREMPEGQDMIVEFAPAQREDMLAQDYTTGTAPEIFIGDEAAPDDDTIEDPLEMWLNY